MRERSTRRWHGAALAVALLGMQGALGCHVRVNGMTFGNNRVSVTVQKKFVADKVDTLRVLSASGDIQVEPAVEGVEEITIRATKVVSGRPATEKLRSLLDKVQTTAVLEGRTLVVQSNYPQNAQTANTSATVNYVITAPKRLALDLQSASGDIQTQGMNGGAKIQSASGDVELHGGAGQIEVSTSSGSITIADAQIRSSLTLHSSSGDVEITKLRVIGPMLNVDVTTQSGGIQFSGDTSDLKLQTASGDIQAETTSVLTLNAAEIHSASGTVSLKLPKTVSANITLKTASGDISAPEPDKRPTAAKSEDEENRHDIQLTLGAGKAPVHLQTSSGDITLETEP